MSQCNKVEHWDGICYINGEVTNDNVFGEDCRNTGGERCRYYYVVVESPR